MHFNHLCFQILIGFCSGHFSLGALKIKGAVLLSWKVIVDIKITITMQFSKVCVIAFLDVFTTLCVRKMKIFIRD